MDPFLVFSVSDDRELGCIRIVDLFIAASVSLGNDHYIGIAADIGSVPVIKGL